MAEHDHDHGHDHAHDHGHDHGHDHAHEGEHDHEHEPQTVTVEDVGPARKCLTIEIPADRIAKKIQESYSKLKSDAVLPGFRRGRAPKQLLEKRFGDSVRDEVRGQIIGESYGQAIEEQKLDVIGEPEVKDLDQIKLPDSGSMTFKVEVEVSPKFDLPSLEGIEINKPKTPVSDADVEKEIDQLRNRQGKLTEAADGSVKDEDYVLADVRILAGADAADGAEEIAHHPGAYILVHGEKQNFRGHVAGIVVEDLGKRMTGKKVGDEVRISMTGPAAHEDARIKEKPITIVVKVTKIERLEPAAIDTLPAQLGLQSVDELKQRIREMLESRQERQQQQAMHEQVSKYLLDKVQFDLPKNLSERQAARLLRRQALEMLYMGTPEQEIQQKIADLRAGSAEEAAKQLKLFFVLDQAAKQLQIEVSEAEVNGRIAMMAMQQNRRPEKLRQQMIRSGEIDQLYLQVREQKTLDKIIEKAKVTEVDAPAAK